MQNNPVRTHRLIALFIGLQLFIADQWSKEWILDWAMTATSPLLAEVTSFFNLVLVWNFGISFGLFPANSPEGTLLLTGATGLLSLILFIWFLRSPRVLTLYGLALVIGGAVGNIVDRIRHGAVVDFLDFHLYGYHWPAFNIADSIIFLGVVLLLLDSILEARNANPTHQDETP